MCAASIARKIYLRAGTGVGAFRKIYGGNKNKGTRKEHFQKASGGMIRSILLNLESMGVVEKMEDGYVPSPVAPAWGCCRCGSRGVSSGAGRVRRGRLCRCSQGQTKWHSLTLAVLRAGAGKSRRRGRRTWTWWPQH